MSKKGDKLQQEESSKVHKENISLRAWAISLWLILSGLIVWWIHGWGEVELLKVLWKHLTEILLMAGFIGIVYELWIRREFEREMENTVLRAVNANATLLKEKFRGEAVDSIIRNCLEAKLCNEGRATALYEGLISPYVAVESFRNKFDYEIKLNKLDNNITANEITFSRDSYFRVIEELTYIKRLNIKSGMEFVVGLCLNDSQLENYKDKNCIYRTIFRIGESEKAVLNRPLPEDIFKIEVKLNDKELTSSLTEYDAKNGIKIVCKYKGEKINVDEESTFYVKVVTLHNKNVNYYTAYLYDPSKCPKIKLHYTDEIKDIFAVTHFTTSKGKDVIPKRDNDARHISVDTDEWVFPTSGVVFVWKLCNKED